MEDIHYDLSPVAPSGGTDAFSVLRNGRALSGVVVGSLFKAEVVAIAFRRWFVVEATCLDPGLRKNPHNEYYCHPTTIVASLADRVAYVEDRANALATASLQAGPGWVEGMTAGSIFLGTSSPDISLAGVVDGTSYDMEYERGPSSIRLRLWTSLLRIYGNENYRYRAFGLALGVKEAASSALGVFFRESVYSRSYVDFTSGEVELASVSFDPTPNRPGMNLWLRGSKPGRTYYVVHYRDDGGTHRVAMAQSVLNGTFYVFLNGVTSYAAVAGAVLK